MKNTEQLLESMGASTDLKNRILNVVSKNTKELSDDEFWKELIELEKMIYDESNYENK